MKRLLTAAAVLGALLHLGALESVHGARRASLWAQEQQAIPGAWFAQGGWAACRRDTEFWILHNLRHNPKKWLYELGRFEKAQICTATREDDMLVIGPSNIPFAVNVAFQDREDLHPAIAFYLFWGAVYDLPPGLVYFPPNR